MTSQPHSHFIELCQQRGIPDPRSGELARHLDECDPLRHLRSEFHIPKFRTLPGFESTATLGKFGENEESDSIYLCGNSLGLMPKRTETLMNRQFEKWQQMQVLLLACIGCNFEIVVLLRGVHGHLTEPVPWAYCDERCIEGMGKLVGAESAEEIGAMNSLTVNIHLLFTAFYQPNERRYKV